MGYMLSIDKKEGKNRKNLLYGTKLYGYFDYRDLESCKYLVDIGKIDETDFILDDLYFGYNSTINFELTKKQLKKFLKLYEKDYNRVYSKIYFDYDNSFSFKDYYGENIYAMIDDYKGDTLIIDWC